MFTYCLSSIFLGRDSVMGGLCTIEERAELHGRKIRNFYPKLLRAGIEAVLRKRIKCMSVVVQLCTRVHVHGLNLHLSEDFTVDSFALS